MNFRCQTRSLNDTRVIISVQGPFRNNWKCDRARARENHITLHNRYQEKITASLEGATLCQSIQIKFNNQTTIRLYLAKTCPLQRPRLLQTHYSCFCNRCCCSNGTCSSPNVREIESDRNSKQPNSVEPWRSRCTLKAPSKQAGSQRGEARRR